MENSKILSNTDYRRNFTPCKGDRENITPNKDKVNVPTKIKFAAAI